MEDHHRPQQIVRQVNVAEHQADDRGVGSAGWPWSTPKKSDETSHAVVTPNLPRNNDAAADPFLEDRSEDHQRKDGPESAAHFERQFGHQPQQRFEHHADGEHQHEGPQQQGFSPGPSCAHGPLPPREMLGKRDRHRAEIERRHHLAAAPTGSSNLKSSPCPAKSRKTIAAVTQAICAPRRYPAWQQVAPRSGISGGRSSARRDCGRLSRESWDSAAEAGDFFSSIVSYSYQFPTVREHFFRYGYGFPFNFTKFACATEFKHGKGNRIGQSERRGQDHDSYQLSGFAGPAGQESPVAGRRSAGERHLGAGLRHQPRRHLRVHRRTETGRRSASPSPDVKNLWVLPSSIDLVAADTELPKMENAHHVMKRIVDSVRGKFDYIFIDCSPSLGYHGQHPHGRRHGADPRAVRIPRPGRAFQTAQHHPQGQGRTEPRPRHRGLPADDVHAQPPEQPGGERGPRALRPPGLRHNNPAQYPFGRSALAQKTRDALRRRGRRLGSFLAPGQEH